MRCVTTAILSVIVVVGLIVITILLQPSILPVTLLKKVNNDEEKDTSVDMEPEKTESEKSPVMIPIVPKGDDIIHPYQSFSHWLFADWRNNISKYFTHPSPYHHK
jgi:hypothetical protein|uniref:Uncharacterized protein n=1 Tax=viral metagenome TaxID=1070528 RepID=A0A6C0IU47_9ZZZZ